MVLIETPKKSPLPGIQGRVSYGKSRVLAVRRMHPVKNGAARPWGGGVQNPPSNATTAPHDGKTLSQGPVNSLYLREMCFRSPKQRCPAVKRSRKALGTHYTSGKSVSGRDTGATQRGNALSAPDTHAIRRCGRNLWAATPFFGSGCAIFPGQERLFRRFPEIVRPGTMRFASIQP
jgi:hypothetical protein